MCGMVALCAGKKKQTKIFFISENKTKNSGCNVIDTHAAFAIGVIAGFTYLGLESLMIYRKLDDPLGSVATHLGGGIVGVLLTPFFMKENLSGIPGILYWKGKIFKISIKLTHTGGRSL